MAKKIFKDYDRGQTILFPSNLDERIKKDSPARLIDKIVDSLDISELIRRYEQDGAPSYHPRMLVKVIFYAYLNNIYSCRKIADATNKDIEFMWLSGDQQPSFSTINRFRSNHCKNCINTLFGQVVIMLNEKGQVSLDTVYVDGTKVESVANKYTFVWKKNVERYKSKLEEKIRSILAQIDEGIAQDNVRTAEEPRDIIDSEQLRKAIEEINQQQRADVQTKEQKKQIRELEKHKKKLQEYEEQLRILGERNSYSKTDTSATFMQMKGDEQMNKGVTKPAYNLQIGTENQYITNYALYPNPGDTATLPSFLNLYYARLGKLPSVICADAGYGSHENYELLEDNGVEAFVKYNYFHKEQGKAFRNDPSKQENLHYNEQEDYFVCPMGQRMSYIGTQDKISKNGFRFEVRTYRAHNCEGCPMRGVCHKATGNREITVNHELRKHKQKARERLNSPEGVAHRKKRSVEPESVFGQMKFNKQYFRFRHREFDKVNMDFGIFAIAFNLKKLHNNIIRQRKKTAKTKNGAGNAPFFVLILVLWTKWDSISAREGKMAA